MTKLTLHTNRASARGITLVEMLVSTVILSLALIAASQLYMASVWTHQKAQALVIASAKGQYELEKALQLGRTAYDSLFDAKTPLAPTYYPSPYTKLNDVPYGVALNEVPGLSNGNVTIVYTPNPFNYNRNRAVEDARLARVVITVQWKTRNQTQHIVLTSYIARKPVTGGGA